MSLFVMGAIAPQDPITGAVIGKPWIADRNKPTQSRGYRIPQLPLQAGTIVTDAIQKLPDRFAVEYTLSDMAATLHPIPSFYQRSRFLAISFKAIEQRKGPVLVWCRGYAPGRDYGIESVEQDEPLDQTIVTLRVNFGKLNFTTLVVVPVAVDVELLAAGIVPL